MLNRRSFVKKSVLSSFAAIVGAEIVFGSNMIDGYTPLALQEPDPFKLFKKNNEMVVLNDKPWNIEAKAHLLDDKVTPNSSMFIRNNGKIIIMVPDLYMAWHAGASSWKNLVP